MTSPKTVSQRNRRSVPDVIGEVSPRVVLALGADIKNRFLLSCGASFYFGPDIGDLSEAENFELFKKEVAKATRKVRPDIIACDLHPGYFSTQFAKTYDIRHTTYDIREIQHHHAHIASVIQEHNLKGKVLGVSFDGTGHGTDGNSWGGEFLLVEGSGFRRLTHLKYRKMPGGDKVVSEPWRMVLSILGKKASSFLKGVGKKEKELILAMLDKDVNCPKTSSAGRLFDAAAALLGVCVYASYEAEGPIKLEAMCDKKINEYYNFDIVKDKGFSVIDADGIFLGMLKDLKKTRDKHVIAAKFHNSMVKIVVDTVKNLAKSLRIKDVALSGGVFQNSFLRTKVVKELANLGFGVFTNVNTPVNDLNISLGQYYVSCRTGKS